MTDIMYEVPSRLDIAAVEITPDCIRREGDCRYVLRKDLLEAEAAEDNALPSPADTASN
jgi:ATP-dependent protease Clp ATPase subunit